MHRSTDLQLSVVVPVCNEEAGLAQFHQSLVAVLQKAFPKGAGYEVLYVDDGSVDNTLPYVRKLAEADEHVRVVTLSRNFGKEIAITAGIHEARGQAILTMDADGQHPVELIPEFIARWNDGSKVVIGLRTANERAGFIKVYGSRLFYWFFNRFTGMKLIPGSTDFRLIDHTVQEQFVRMTEHARITRGLIDWLGFERSYISFEANERIAGTSPYSTGKLIKLAVDSVISLSISPLYFAAYMGLIVLPLSLLLGLFMAAETLLGDPMNLHITGGAFVLVFVLFLIGILLLSQGIIGLYLSHIHNETQNRPLYIINREASVRLNVD